eukprot:TRINITY_DN15808_c0_g1_i1.p1 TRINITY_DN15808_c0_g1~~TRINITY_DN15808_c0_g1_i1.p1  ORF type:complete len:461 (+),score=99.53 TRINITY_DN15808_c0_g1_i1:87-1469(+)
MALAGVYQIQRDKYSAHASQAGLLTEVQQRSQLRAELRKSQSTQEAVSASMLRSQAEHESEIAAQQLRTARWHLEERRISILLQGFHSIIGVMGYMSFTSAIVTGFASSMFILQRVDNTPRSVRWTYWALSMITIKLLVHCVFVTAVGITSSTKLCYQGTLGKADVERSYHGLMSLSSEVFWDFIAGFVAFLLLVVFALWVKLEENTPGDPGPTSDVYGSLVSVVVWCVPVIRMIRTYRSVRQEFRIDYSSFEPDAETMLQEAGAGHSEDVKGLLPSDFEFSGDPPRSTTASISSDPGSPMRGLHAANREAMVLSGEFTDAPFSPKRRTPTEPGIPAAPAPAASPLDRFGQLEDIDQKRVLALTGRPDPLSLGDRRFSRAALFGGLPQHVRTAAWQRWEGEQAALDVLRDRQPRRHTPTTSSLSSSAATPVQTPLPATGWPPSRRARSGSAPPSAHERPA